MSDKLYLIRVDMERFIGPATLKEVRDAYRRMEFGLQDEIASSNKPWVAFDDLERINRIYPELGHLIKKEMLSGWGSTEPEPKIIPSYDSADSMPKKSMGWFLKGSAFLVLIMLSLGSFFFVRGDKLQDVKLMLQEPTYSKAKYYYGDYYNEKFEAFMEKNSSEVNRSMKRKGYFKAWLPYIRAFAFSTSGDWKGLNAKKLRGKDANFSPADCSLATWKSKWESSKGQWASFLEGRVLPNQDWARILVWDTTWIKQRLNHKYWLSPRNYYEACILMARKALNQSIEKTSLEAKVIDARLKWSLSLINDSDADEEFEMSGSLWSLSCVESSNDDEAIDECIKNKDFNSDWKQLLNFRSNLRKARSILANNSQLQNRHIEDLKNKLQKIEPKDNFTKFDYRDEVKYFQTLIQAGGDLERADKTIKERNSTLNFEY